MAAEVGFDVSVDRLLVGVGLTVGVSVGVEFADRVGEVSGVVEGATAASEREADDDGDPCATNVGWLLMRPMAAPIATTTSAAPTHTAGLRISSRMRSDPVLKDGKHTTLSRSPGDGSVGDVPSILGHPVGA